MVNEFDGNGREWHIENKELCGVVKDAQASIHEFLPNQGQRKAINVSMKRLSKLQLKPKQQHDMFNFLVKMATTHGNQ